MAQDTNPTKPQQIQHQTHESASNGPVGENQPHRRLAPKSVTMSSHPKKKSSKWKELVGIALYLAMFISLMLLVLIAGFFFLMPLILLMMKEISYAFRKCVDSFFASRNEVSPSGKKRQ